MKTLKIKDLLTQVENKLNDLNIDGYDKMEIVDILDEISDNLN